MAEKRKTNGKRNRGAGHGFERIVAGLVRKAGYPNAITTREGDRSKDAAGIDIMNRDQAKNGKLPYSIQAKCTTCPVSYHGMLSGMPQDETINVVFHRYTKLQKDGRFHPQGQYAILNMDKFIQLMTYITKLEAQLEKKK